MMPTLHITAMVSAVMHPDPLYPTVLRCSAVMQLMKCYNKSFHKNFDYGVTIHSPDCQLRSHSYNQEAITRPHRTHYTGDLRSRKADLCEFTNLRLKITQGARPLRLQSPSN